MSDLVDDTHALIWYLEDSPRLSPAANQAFEQCDRGEIIIYIPTICLVEIVYLQEKGRISADMKLQLDTALIAGTSGLILSNLTDEIVAALATIPRDSVPDMPDRIIAATAKHLGLPLISRDSKMPLSGVNVIW
ncbi:twitching motility protein PilT [Nostoc minutum NIES-26]|uniref:Twitching motility protein PilT n=1 Tax=Nostoc minutum NIES-26 TaxID=1844469 RepID=A0A367QL44_9NOSO|nr:type II toxin-antitoxin system VapC family toxin [Dendronalium sp. ChiSLP03b]MDZ8204485.1 type II toxin-antitoxin system VapC family toxin [Dendronalium sp. ChiSLP03b]RCJ24759.1 twitching motility protein PilT [Nostoc minutum NIES-26]